MSNEGQNESSHHDLYNAGIVMRRKVMGDDYVDRQLKQGASDFMSPMQELATEAAWGTIWTRPGLELKQRSLIVIALLASQGKEAEVRTAIQGVSIPLNGLLTGHIRGAVNNGATEIEIRETLLQTATYIVSISFNLLFLSLLPQPPSSPMASTAPLPGFFLCFAAMVLLIFVSVSVPTWNSVYFLRVGPSGSDQLRYGVFGFTGSSVRIGYDFTNDSLNTTILHNLTKTLILHPIAAALAGLAAIFGLLGFISRVGTIAMTFFSGLAALTTFVAWIIDMILFGIARTRYRNDGTPAQYGNANWLTLGAFVALLLGFCASACGIFGRYRRRRDVTY
ncbi:hypothetical protein CVT24_003422 [Panaeolus cyanescens]|uniref:Uncharacterized protein n=1 Tax=Panaeolus cyanescens TaxID=181874 RepID=A0A409Y6S0_9AGAR|nr:hypothetical protein CVT24_003422 [Panaeolus cyanescens]